MELKKTGHRFAILLFSLTVVAITSCDSRRVFDQTQTVPDNIWDRSKTLKFEVPITDTVNSNNVYLNIRHAEGYPYNNLFLFVHMKFPNGKVYTDTVDCTLADENGKWLGSGAGDIYDVQVPFKGNVRFRDLGTYTIELEQAMRLDKLPMIMDAGVRIERRK